MRLFYVYVVLFVGRGFATDWSPVQGVLPTMYRIKKLKSGNGRTEGCRVIDSKEGITINELTFRIRSK
jgi:hypothetical protein